MYGAVLSHFISAASPTLFRRKKIVTLCSHLQNRKTEFVSEDNLCEKKFSVCRGLKSLILWKRLVRQSMTVDGSAPLERSLPPTQVVLAGLKGCHTTNSKPRYFKWHGKVCKFRSLLQRHTRSCHDPLYKVCQKPYTW